jgi:hypothetical protein
MAGHERSRTTGTRAARDAHVAASSRPLVPAARRVLVLAVATFAALVTLVLPAPAMARPVSPVSGSMASAGGAPAASVTLSGRRTHRGEQAGSVAGHASTGGADAWSHSHASAVAGSSSSGLTLAAALPPSSSTGSRALGLVRSPHDAGAAPLALVGARGSRAPPTL